MINKIKRHKRIFISSLLLLCLTVGGTIAFLQSKTNTLTNTFNLGTIETEIEEKDPIVEDSAISKEPYVINTSNNSALVRARVSITPPDIVKKYSITLTYGDDWKYNESDGYYYYTGILEGKQSTTTPIITKVNGNNIIDTNGNINSGLNGLEIAIYHESIQTFITDENGNTIVTATTGDINNSDTKKLWEKFDKLNNVN